MHTQTIKVFVQHVSLTDLEGVGLELGDDGKEVDQFFGKEQNAFFLSVLTKRQRTVAELLVEGYKRKEIALKREICLQAVHQIILRIRKRLRERAGIKF